MYTLEMIVNKLKQAKPGLERKYPISGIGVFGSFARGEATAESDIDIVVDIDRSMGLNFVEMADEIESLFGIKTDVILGRAVKPEYLAFIEKEIVYVW